MEERTLKCISSLNEIAIDWPDLSLDYPQSSTPGLVKRSSVSLLDGTGQEVYDRDMLVISGSEHVTCLYILCISVQ